MKHLTPQRIAEITGGLYIGNENERNTRVEGAVRDNRDVKPGNLFVCIYGDRVDGHTFVNSAFESGAACCLTERIVKDANGPYVFVESTLEAIKTLGKHYRGLFNIPVIGVAGSVGKTTMKELIAATLGTKLRVLKTPMNLNNELGVPLTLLSLDERHEAAVIEMGISDFGEMGRLAQMVRPDIFILTKIGYSHVDMLGSLDGVLRAKSEAFVHMDTSGVAVVNGDDNMLWELNPGMRKITFGLNKRNAFHAENVRLEGIDAVICDIVSDMGRLQVKIPSYGSHLATLAPAAVAVSRLLGLTDAEINRGFSSYNPVGGRSYVKRTGAITLIDDCYNANPHSVMSALTSLSALPGKRVAILGDMLGLGNQSNKLHCEIGLFAAKCSLDNFICCGDKIVFANKSYRSAAGGTSEYFQNKADLIAVLPELIERGDNVLVKASRAMKFEEIAEFLFRL